MGLLIVYEKKWKLLRDENETSFRESRVAANK